MALAQLPARLEIWLMHRAERRRDRAAARFRRRLLAVRKWRRRVTSRRGGIFIRPIRDDIAPLLAARNVDEVDSPTVAPDSPFGI